MLLPAFLTANPLLFPTARLNLLWWMLGLLSCIAIPVIAGVVHRSRGIGYACGVMGAIIFMMFGCMSFMVFNSV